MRRLPSSSSRRCPWPGRCWTCPRQCRHVTVRSFWARYTGAWLWQLASPCSEREISLLDGAFRSSPAPGRVGKFAKPHWRQREGNPGARSPLYRVLPMPPIENTPKPLSQPMDWKTPTGGLLSLLYSLFCRNVNRVTSGKQNNRSGCCPAKRRPTCMTVGGR